MCALHVNNNIQENFSPLKLMNSYHDYMYNLETAPNTKISKFYIKISRY